MEWLDFHQIFLYVQRSASLIGILIILSGIFISFGQYIRYLFSHKIRDTSETNLIRLNLGRILVLGLEFIVAADLINTMTTPDYYSVGILASIVVIRTVLSYTLNLEISTLSKETSRLQP